MAYNIYMKTWDKKWLVVPFGKSFDTIEEAEKALRKLAKQLKNTELGIHEGADHSKTGLLTGEPSYIHGK